MTLERVLIVDDSDADRYLLRRMIRRGEIANEVLEAVDGSAALELLKQCQQAQEAAPRVVFVDINMPGMNGFQFLEAFDELRQDPFFTSVAVMMLSSTAEQDDKERSLSYEFVRDFVTKMPDDETQLREAIDSALAG